ncbi:hypothetical protein ABZ477_07050 [Microbacterium sp. NPDC019599]|uniref:hypothetical protein n=1 Tax=Microbacterium sp. NPDC019599 TaxID=3154690 RepID=UPI0033CDF31D
MSLAVVLLALGCLVAATILWQRNKKAGVNGAGTGRTRVAIIVLVVAGILLALASQTLFRG